MTALPALGAGPAPDRWGAVPEAELEGTSLLSFEFGRVPVFRVAETDRLAAGLGIQWTPHPSTSIWGSTCFARTRSPGGSTRAGMEGVELGSRLRPLGERPSPIEPGLSWWTRLPLGQRIDGVASPAADLSLAFELGHALGPVRLELAAGLQILGNPLLDAEQDDRLLWRATGSVATGPLDAYASAQGTLASPRNPAQAELAVGIQRSCPGRIGLEVATGLSPTGPDVALRAWGGFARACRTRVGD